MIRIGGMELGPIVEKVVDNSMGVIQRFYPHEGR